MKKVICFLVVVLITICSFGFTTALAGSSESVSAAPFTDNIYYTEDYVIDAENSVLSAASGASTRALPVFNNPEITLSSPSTGKINVIVKITTTTTVTKLGIQSLQLQVNNDGTWANYGSPITDQYATNTNTYRYSNSASTTSGSEYRVKVTFLAQNSSGTRTISATSTGITSR